MPRMMPYLIALLLAVPLIAHAQDSEVELRLTGGEVAGPRAGFGTASVEVTAINRSARTLQGIRIAAYYSTSDSMPGLNADWRVHEFVFEPPLQPGSSTVLRFSDENAAEYVLVETRGLQYTDSLRFNGRTVDLAYPLLYQSGTAYISVRDLAAAAGASLALQEGRIVLDLPTRRITLLPGTAEATVRNQPLTLSRPLLLLDGRSYIAAEAAAELLSMRYSRDAELDVIELSEPTG